MGFDVDAESYDRFMGRYSVGLYGHDSDQAERSSIPLTWRGRVTVSVVPLRPSRTMEPPRTSTRSRIPESPLPVTWVANFTLGTLWGYKPTHEHF